MKLAKDEKESTLFIGPLLMGRGFSVSTPWRLTSLAGISGNEWATLGDSEAPFLIRGTANK